MIHARWLLVVTLLCAPAVQAGIVEYQFSALVNVEFDPAAPSPGTLPPTLFPLGTSVSGTFFYNADAPLTASGLSPSIFGLDPAAFGPVNTFDGAVSGFSGSIGGTTFASAASGNMAIADAPPGIIDLLAFTINGPGLVPVSAAGGFALQSATIFSVGFMDFLDGTLPSAIELGDINSGVNLRFENAAGDVRIVQAHESVSIVAVPTPATLFLMMIGLALVGAHRYRVRSAMA